MKDRPDIDRWILSDLQQLIRSSRTAFENYDVMAFCLEIEKFVDDKLSNWYVRTTKKRFWSRNAELNAAQKRDKLAAYQTLYTVLMTLTKLCAPVMPFLAETMYQNLKAGADSKESVHLCDYPQVDQKLIDAALSAEMDALLDLVSLGSKARNSVKIKVRQPLAELKVQPSSEAECKAVQRFRSQIEEELNIEKVTLHDASARDLLKPEVKGNQKTLGPKFGHRLREVTTALASCVPERVAEAVEKGEPFDLKMFLDPNKLEVTMTGELMVDPQDVLVSYKAPDGWAGAVEKKTQAALDVRITEPLKRKGMAREVVRYVQDARKDAGLDMEDHIELCLHTESPPLAQAIDEHRPYIAVQTQADRWISREKITDHLRKEVEIDGAALLIALRKV
jgi:isoleucyl-tRNA synthetase